MNDGYAEMVGKQIIAMVEHPEDMDLTEFELGIKTLVDLANTPPDLKIKSIRMKLWCDVYEAAEGDQNDRICTAAQSASLAVTNFDKEFQTQPEG